jgi:NADH dehydrogenase
MTILVTGAAGYLGNVTVKKLVAMGKPVRAMVRNVEKAEKRLADVKDQIEIVQGDVTDRASLPPLMKDVTAVIHYVAIAMEKGGQTYDEVNYQGTVNVLDAAREAGVKRFLNMSQNGAKSDLPYRFLASKGRAQEYVAQSDMQWTAFRPSAIFGPQDEFFNTFARLLKITPIVFPLVGGGKAEFQPVSSDDVTEAVVRSLDDDTTIGKELVLGGPEVLTLAEIEKRIIGAMGTWRLLVPAPTFVLRPAVVVMQSVLPGSPVTTSLLDLLAVKNTVDDNALVSHFGMDPIPFAGEHIAYLNDNTIGDTMAKFFQNATVN